MRFQESATQSLEARAESERLRLQAHDALVNRAQLLANRRRRIGTRRALQRTLEERMSAKR